jgi:Fe-S oxidoreductase
MGTPVVLWADTFNNCFHPETARAAVEVLERAGFQVSVPRGDLCCGRPLYDYGFLRQARRRLLEVLRALEPAIRSGTPIVVLEPSCASVFRDELPNLLPLHENARRLAGQIFTLDELLIRHAPHFRWPALQGKALVHGHCHHKSVLDFGAEEEALGRLGLEVVMPEPGCCGMAGAFGFETGDHYEVSRTCGEHRLLPAVRAADRATLVVADGFSCREQIAQGTGRRALHLAELLQVALAEESGVPRRTPAESVLVERRQVAEQRARRRAALVAGTIGGAALAGATLVGALRRR